MAIAEGDGPVEVVLSVEEAMALSDALEAFMRLRPDQPLSYNEYRKLWDAADVALVPLRGGPYSMANRTTDSGKEPPSWRLHQRERRGI